MTRILLFAAGMFILIGSEIMKVYFIMPFPGSQQQQTIDLAYFIHNYIWPLRLTGITLAIYPAYIFLKNDNIWIRWPVIVLLGFWLFAAYMFNFRFLAEEMFYQPKIKRLAQGTENKVPVQNLVIGVSLNGESKAYPIEVIGYHHQVRDTVGGQPVMVTYCTVCRTGRVFSPMVDGQGENFRLVGMDHFNAMFEDSRTKTWWRQVNGEAITGPLKGKMLDEIPSEQMSLDAWMTFHPETFVLQPDSNFNEAYKDLGKYDEGKTKGNLEKKDSLPWKDKSWIVGVQIGMDAKAYDWIELTDEKVIHDKLAGTSLLVALEKDTVTFHVWKRPDSLEFVRNDSLNMLVDTNTNSHWNWNGQCVEGKLAGNKLEWQQSYQEYWHSWKTFRPQTTQFKAE